MIDHYLGSDRTFQLARGKAAVAWSWSLTSFPYSAKINTRRFTLPLICDAAFTVTWSICLLCRSCFGDETLSNFILQAINLFSKKLIHKRMKMDLFPRFLSLQCIRSWNLTRSSLVCVSGVNGIVKSEPNRSVQHSHFHEVSWHNVKDTYGHTPYCPMVRIVSR